MFSDDFKVKGYVYAASVFTAGTSIVPTCVLFNYATQKRMSEGPMVYMTTRDALRAGVGASPSIALIVGSQLLLQAILTQGAKRVYNTELYPLLTNMAASVAACFSTAHLEYAFTQYAMGNPTPWVSVMQLTGKQAIWYAMRNGAALFGITGGSAVAKKIKEQSYVKRLQLLYPKTEVGVDYVSTIFVGALGGFVGHPFNCKIIEEALRQAGKPTPQLPWYRGVGYRALSIATFSLLNKVQMDCFKYALGVQDT